VPLTDEALLELAARVGSACRSRGLTLATAESCTGGLITHLLTELPGASTYLRGGLVTYADAAKTSLADVPEPVLDAHGAVSAQVALAMAAGARQRLGSDLAVAVTGIAGPAGGSAAKPVGLTYVAMAHPDGDEVRRYAWTGDRAANKRSSAEAALALLADWLEA
jgi:PncC family amidohydrolase